MTLMKFGRRQFPEPEPVPVPPPSYDPPSGAAFTPGYPPASPVDQTAGFPPLTAGAMPPGFAPAAPGAMPPGFSPAFGGGVLAGFPGSAGLPRFAASMQNPRVLDALVRSGKFRTHEEAQAWVSQMVARATQSAAQQAAFGGMQPGWANGQQVPGAGQQTFQDLMDQAKKKGRKGRGH